MVDVFYVFKDYDETLPKKDSEHCKSIVWPILLPHD